MTIYNVLLEENANVRAFVRSYGLTTEREFEAITGFTLEDPSDQVLRRLSRDPMVRVVAEAQVPTEDALRAEAGPGWGLAALLETPSAFSGRYSYSRDGAGVHAYVIEPGRVASHSDFDGTDVAAEMIFVASPAPTAHATSVASVLVGRESGVAPRATLVAVVSNTDSDFASAIDAIIAHHQGHGGPSVINFSASWPTGSTVADTAAQAAVDAGIVFVTSAGNGGVSADNMSPNRVAAVVTVGGYTAAHTKATESNYGASVDIWAPYAYLRTADASLSTRYTYSNGTSFGSPYVAGIAALILQAEPTLTPAQVSQRLIDDSLVGALTGLTVDDNNRIARISPTVRDTGAVHSPPSSLAVEVVALDEPPAPAPEGVGVKVLQRWNGSSLTTIRLRKWTGAELIDCAFQDLSSDSAASLPLNLPFTLGASSPSADTIALPLNLPFTLG